MTTLKKVSLVVGTALVAIAPALCFASTFSGTTDAQTVIASAIGDISTTLGTEIPVVLLVATALLGVYIVWRFAKRVVK